MGAQNIRLESVDQIVLARGVAAAESAARAAGIATITTTVISADSGSATLNLRRYLTTPSGQVDHIINLNVFGTPSEIQRVVTWLNQTSYIQDDHEYQRGLYGWSDGLGVASDQALARRLTPHIPESVWLGVPVCAC